MSSTDPSKYQKDDCSDNAPLTTTTSPTSSNSTWKLEESSVWWISNFIEAGNSSGWINNPGNVLLLTSVPFFAGAYFGYRMPTERLEDLIQGGTSGYNGSGKAASKLQTSDKDAIRAAAARTASKALRIATLGTVGTFGFVGAIGFYLSGYNSVDEAVKGTSSQASSWGKSLEHLMGGDQGVSKTHPEVLATKHMKADEELRYIYDKYIKEDDYEDSESTSWHDSSDTNKEEDKAPTLYAVYEKYFMKKDDK